MIIDLERFINTEQPYWEELESFLEELDHRDRPRLDVTRIRRLHYLYERVSSDLAKLSTFASERETRRYLEGLVARAYGEIHETRERPHRFQPLRWLFGTLPRTFRRHIRAFNTATAVILLGSLLGTALLLLDSRAKEIMLPYDHLMISPTERVEKEEARDDDRLRGMKARGAAWYMTHNTKVGIGTMAMGATYGIGTLLLLFTNGILLGAVSADYILDGQAEFLIGWLLPHGSVEIPAIMIAGQAGLILAGALIGWRSRVPLRDRLRLVMGDVVTLFFGFTILFTWAGVIESFLSQYHEPVIPYKLKIAFGVVQLVLLTTFLVFAGRKRPEGKRA